MSVHAPPSPRVYNGGWQCCHGAWPPLGSNRVDPSDHDFEKLIRPVQDRMVRSAWRILGNAGDAEDALQDALTAIWARRRRVCGHPNPEALILRMCANAAYDLLRRKARRNGPLQPLPAQVAASSPCAADHLSQQELSKQVRAAIGQLPRKQGLAVLMRVVQEQPYGAIAEALGCKVATARKHVHRGRSRLARTLRHLRPDWMEGKHGHDDH